MNKSRTADDNDRRAQEEEGSAVSQDAEKYTPKRGDPCRKCGTTFVVKPNMFFLTGIGTFSGLVCEPCNSLWTDPEDNFLAAAAKRDKIRDEFGKGNQDLIPPPKHLSNLDGWADTATRVNQHLDGHERR